MIFLTSIKGTSVITRRNIVAEVIAFVFIVLCSDMPNPRHATSEPAEHMFGNMRQQIREFTILECSQLIEKLLRRLRLMFKNNLRPSRDPQYGYQATYREYFDYSLGVVEGVLDGTVDLTFDGGVAVAEQLWDVVKSIISFSNGLMVDLFENLGVQKAEFLPFVVILSRSLT